MNLNARQREVLAEIGYSGPIGIAELAFRCLATDSATRSAVKRLEARGLVDYTLVDGGHTHVRRWFLTDAGEREDESKP